MNKEEFLAFIAGEGADMFNEVTAERGLATFNDETVNAYLNTDSGKSITEKIGNRIYAEKFKQYKETDFMKDFNAEYQKRHPEMTEADKKLMELERELTDYKRKEVINTNTLKLKETGSKFGLFDEVYSLVVGEDFEASKTLLEKIGTKYQSHFKDAVDAEVTKRLGETPKPKGAEGTGKKADVIDDIWNKTINGGF